MEDHIHTNEELANILALGLDRAALSARPLLTPPVCVAELGNLRGEEQADAKDIADFAATRRGIRTACGFVTATTGDGDDLRSLKIHLESDPWFADSFSIDRRAHKTRVSTSATLSRLISRVPSELTWKRRALWVRSGRISVLCTWPANSTYWIAPLYLGLPRPSAVRAKCRSSGQGALCARR